jgi:hypothetical protein
MFATRWRITVLSLTGSRVSHSQTTTGRQPSAFNISTCWLSRCLLRSSFGTQYAVFDFGTRARLQCSWECQKQPLTNNATDRPGKTMSGVPGSLVLWSRNRNPKPCAALRTSISAPVCSEETRDMVHERCLVASDEIAFFPLPSVVSLSESSIFVAGQEKGVRFRLLISQITASGSLGALNKTHKVMAHLAYGPSIPILATCVFSWDPVARANLPKMDGPPGAGLGREHTLSVGLDARGIFFAQDWDRCSGPDGSPQPLNINHP